MHRLLRAAIALWLPCLLLAACGGGGGGDDIAAPPVETPAPVVLAAWQPAPGAVPASGNYVYLSSASGEYVGAGRDHLFTPAVADLSIGAAGTDLIVLVRGAALWDGSFAVPASAGRLVAGQTSNVARYPFHDPALGGLTWSGDGRGCNTLLGSFIIDRVAYTSGALTEVELRFEQSCDGQEQVLRGKLRWKAADDTRVWGPLDARHQRWQPPIGATPAIGNFVFLQSEYGDFIGSGGRYLYTQADALLGVRAQGSELEITLDGDERWSGIFRLPTSASIEPGLYEGLPRFLSSVGATWSGEGRGCNSSRSWVVVDSVSYSGGALASIDMRFEQLCDGRVFALRGRIRWSADDTTVPPGPVDPPPPGLWRAPAGALPASGNALYLASEAGDYVGQGAARLFTEANASFDVDAVARRVVVTVGAGLPAWSVTLQAMDGLPRLQPGYYPSVQRYPFHNPTRGGLDVSGEGRGCNELTGWFVVDRVTYDGAALVAVEARFEQHCENEVPALRGQVRWSAP